MLRSVVNRLQSGVTKTASGSTSINGLRRGWTAAFNQTLPSRTLSYTTGRSATAQLSGDHAVTSRALPAPQLFGSRPFDLMAHRHAQVLTFQATKREVQIIKKLQQAADNNPDDADTQAAFLSELIKVSPQGVVQRFEEGDFAESEATRNLYRRAMVDIAMRNGTLDLGIDRPDGNSTTSGAAAGPFGNMIGSAQSSGQPLPVTLQTPTLPNMLARTIMRMLTYTFVAVLALGSLVTMSNLIGGPGVGGDGEHLPGTSKDSKRSWAGPFGRGGSHKPQKSDKRFEDVIGIDEAVEEVQEIVDYLSHPEQYTRLGGKFPKGLLLTGRPGCGKTLLAKAIAGEAGVPLFYASGSEFEEVFVGLGAKRIRELFTAAHASSPCLVFIDEIDAVGGKRGNQFSRDRATLNELLVQLDGFIENTGVIVIAATNLPETLDDALIRPGRFDRRIDVGAPDIRGRIKLYKHYLGENVEEDVDIESLAKLSPGANGADIFNIVNTAAITAAKLGHELISQADLDYAKDRILMGLENKSSVMSPESLNVTAHHEAGHALITMLNNAANGVYKATIVPRGPALGMVVPMPGKDETSITKKELLAKLDIAMGGRVAEELFFGPENVTTGAGSDLANATQTARALVMNYGMSERIGPQFLGNLRDSEISADLRAKIDADVKDLLDASYARAKEMITKNKDTLVELAEALLEYETLTGPQIQDIIDGRPIREIKVDEEGKVARMKARREYYGDGSHS